MGMPKVRQHLLLAYQGAGSTVLEVLQAPEGSPDVDEASVAGLRFYL
jgi:hypothetical protein